MFEGQRFAILAMFLYWSKASHGQGTMVFLVSTWEANEEVVQIVGVPISPLTKTLRIKKVKKVSHFINRIRTIDFIFVALIWDLDLIRYNLVFNYQLSFLNCSILQDKWVQWDRQLATSIAYWHKRFPSISELQVERKYSYLTVFIPRLIKYPFYKEILLFQLFSRWFDVGFRM